MGAGQQQAITLTLLAALLAGLLLLGVLIWAWGSFLDRYEHDPGRIRAGMFLILSVVTATELGFAADGFIYPWAATVCLLANVWGGLDAVLRYPAAHELESFFSAKQLALMIVKTIVFACGVVSWQNAAVRFLAELLFNIWGLPVIYLTALPLDPAEQVVSDDDYDVDIAVRLWQLAVSSRERRLCMVSCRSWWHKRLHAASECSGVARFVICAASPECRKMFKTSRRRV